MKILVVAAHPDDEVLGCGATIAKHIAEGDEVHVAILGEGITSRYSKREEADPDELEVLHGLAHEVSDFLKFHSLSMFDLPDNRFDSVNLLDIVKIVEGLVRKIEPFRIYTHHSGDLNVDHQISARAVLTATRPTSSAMPVKEIYEFETPSSTEWAFQRVHPLFQPNTFVEISGYLEQKIKALEIYDSEVKPFPHPRSGQALTAIAQKWGSTVGQNACEAFQLIRKIC